MRLVSCAQAVVVSNRIKKPVSIPRCKAGDLRKPIVACACERRQRSTRTYTAHTAVFAQCLALISEVATVRPDGYLPYGQPPTIGRGTSVCASYTSKCHLDQNAVLIARHRSKFKPPTIRWEAFSCRACRGRTRKPARPHLRMTFIR